MMGTSIPMVSWTPGMLNAMYNIAADVNRLSKIENSKKNGKSTTGDVGEGLQNLGTLPIVGFLPKLAGDLIKGRKAGSTWKDAGIGLGTAGLSAATAGLASPLMSAASAAMPAATGALSSAGGAVANAAGAAANATGASGLMSGIMSGIKPATDIAKSAVTPIGDVMKSASAPVIEGAKNLGTDAVNVAKEGISGIKNGFNYLDKVSTDAVKGATKPMVSKLAENISKVPGGDFVNSTAKGVASNWSVLNNPITNKIPEYSLSVALDPQHAKQNLANEAVNLSTDLLTSIGGNAISNIPKLKSNNMSVAPASGTQELSARNIDNVKPNYLQNNNSGGAQNINMKVEQTGNTMPPQNNTTKNNQSQKKTNANFIDTMYDYTKKAGKGAMNLGGKVVDMYSNPNNKAYGWAYPLTGALVGAGVGALVNKKHPLVGAGIGAGIGGLGGWKSGDWLKSNFWNEGNKQISEMEYPKKGKKKKSFLDILTGTSDGYTIPDVQVPYRPSYQP